MDNSQFTATNFDVIFYPDNATLTFDVLALSTIELNTYVEAKVNLYVYGIDVLTRNFSLCQFNQKLICPMQPGHIEISKTSLTISESIVKDIPGVAYTVPDLDARVRVFFYSNTSTQAIACVEAVLSNGRTVQTKYGLWPIAAVSGAFVIISWLVSIFGYSATAAHIALNTISLFVYFQSVAIVLMQAVERCPPIAAAWAQNFMWSLGIIKVKFLQNIANWFVQLTGGTGLAILMTGNQQLSISVQKKRDSMFLNLVQQMYERARIKDHVLIFKRTTYEFQDNDPSLYTTDENDPSLALKILVLRGMQRVAYLAGIEITDLFMTLITFLLFVIFCAVVAWSFIIPLYQMYCRKKYQDMSQPGAAIYTKGILYRLFLVSFPQIIVMCVWQFFERDSAGAIVFAAVLLACWLACMILAVIRVYIKASGLIKQYGNPAAGLYGDLSFLYHIGNLYMGFRADRYWWIGLEMFYLVFKCLMVACLQNHGKAGALIFFITEFLHFVIICFVRPYMDTPTNAFNIVLAIVNTLNALFFAFFSDIFTQPQVVLSIMGIIFFILNAVVALIVLLWMIITCLIALFSRNSDNRYRPTKDDRASFLNPNQMKRHLGMVFGNDKNKDELANLGTTAMKGHDTQLANESLWSDVELAQPPRGYMNESHSKALSGVNNFVFAHPMDPLASLDPLQLSDLYQLPQQPHLVAYGGLQPTSINPYNQQTSFQHY